MVYIDIYYNSKFGYIIASDAKVKNSIIHTVIEPVIVAEPQITKFELTKYIEEAFIKSEFCELVDKSQVGNYKFWHITDVKSFSVFSKRFKALEIKKDGNIYEIIAMVREKNGGYVPSKEENDRIVLELSNDLEVLSEKIIELLNCISKNQKKYESFITLGGNKVSYIISDDEYENLGDGKTDAYQIYKKKNDDDYICFLIDNGYIDFSEKEIKNKWERMYGKLNSFICKDINNNIIIKIIKGSTDFSEYISYIFLDGIQTFELLIKVNLLNYSHEIIEEKKQDYERFINSLKIEKYD